MSSRCCRRSCATARTPGGSPPSRRAEIGEPYRLAGQRVAIGASVGVAVAPGDGRSGEALLSAADLAMYQAKSQRARGWRFYEPRMNAQAQARRELERDLQQGLANGEFELFYQPVLDVSSLRVQAFEAQIRWRQPSADWLGRTLSSRRARRWVSSTRSAPGRCARRAATRSTGRTRSASR